MPVFRRSIDLIGRNQRTICFGIRAVNIYVSENLKDNTGKKLGIKTG
jgi:hypothetical protein